VDPFFCKGRKDDPLIHQCIVAVEDGEDKLNMTSILSKWREDFVPSPIKVGKFSK
jgi:hypothetical protein